MNPTDPIFHKPKSIVAARNLVYASVFISVVIILLRDFNSAVSNYVSISDNAINAIYLVLIIFLIRQVALRKKWARSVLLVIYILTLTGFYFVFKPGSQVGLLEASLFILENVLELAALIFMFRKESNVWFNERREIVQ